MARPKIEQRASAMMRAALVPIILSAPANTTVSASTFKPSLETRCILGLLEGLIGLLKAGHNIEEATGRASLLNF
jgi:hypothetical protein